MAITITSNYTFAEGLCYLHEQSVRGQRRHHLPLATSAVSDIESSLTQSNWNCLTSVTSTTAAVTTDTKAQICISFESESIKILKKVYLVIAKNNK